MNKETSSKDQTKSTSFNQTCSQHKQRRNYHFKLKKQNQGFWEIKSPLEITWIKALIL